MEEIEKIPIENLQGETVGEEEIALTEKGVGQALIYRVVTQEAWNSKPRTAKSKSRGEVRGGGKKPWRQKGTGRARHGSARSPLWRGGGVVFGPLPNARKRKINRKERRKAVRQALEMLIREKRVLLLEGGRDVQGKTKEGALFLEKLDARRGVLLLYGDRSSPIVRTMQNLPQVKLCRGETVLLTDLLGAAKVIIERPAFPHLRRRLWEKI